MTMVSETAQPQDSLSILAQVFWAIRWSALWWLGAPVKYLVLFGKVVKFCHQISAVESGQILPI